MLMTAQYRVHAGMRVAVAAANQAPRSSRPQPAQRAARRGLQADTRLQSATLAPLPDPYNRRETYR